VAWLKLLENLNDIEEFQPSFVKLLGVVNLIAIIYSNPDMSLVRSLSYAEQVFNPYRRLLYHRKDNACYAPHITPNDQRIAKVGGLEINSKCEKEPERLRFIYSIL